MSTYSLVFAFMAILRTLFGIPSGPGALSSSIVFNTWRTYSALVSFILALFTVSEVRAIPSCSGNSVSTILFRLTGHVGDGRLNTRIRFVTSLYAKPHGLESISLHILLKHLRLLSFIVFSRARLFSLKYI